MRFLPLLDSGDFASLKVKCMKDYGIKIPHGLEVLSIVSDKATLGAPTALLNKGVGAQAKSIILVIPKWSILENVFDF
jgi:hypothetical protein